MIDLYLWLVDPFIDPIKVFRSSGGVIIEPKSVHSALAARAVRGQLTEQNDFVLVGGAVEVGRAG